MVAPIIPSIKKEPLGRSNLPDKIPPALFLVLASDKNLKKQSYTLTQLIIGFRKWEQENGKNHLERGASKDKNLIIKLAQDYVRKNSPNYKTPERDKPKTLSKEQQNALNTLEEYGVSPQEMGIDLIGEDEGGTPDPVSRLDDAALAAELVAVAHSASPGTAVALTLVAHQLADVSIPAAKMLIGKLDQRAQTDEEKEVCLEGITHLEPKRLDPEDVTIFNLFAKKEAQMRGRHDPLVQRFDTALAPSIVKDPALSELGAPPAAPQIAPNPELARDREERHRNNPYYIPTMGPRPPRFVNEEQDA